VLYSLCSESNCADGANPYAGLIQDAAGNLYGTTQYGGANGYGTIFKLDSAGQLKVLYNFCSVDGAKCTDGYEPYAGLTQDAAGNLYGTTPLGGANTAANGGYGGGVVFKLALLMTPTVTVTPSSSSITKTQALSVTVGVSGGSGNPTPTGTVTLTSGSYNSGAATLNSGSATIDIPAGSLAVGTDTLTATYSGDSNYNTATGTASVTVMNLVSTNTTLTLSSSTVTVGSSSPITLTADVKPTSGSGTPTGTVTFFNGTTQLGQVALASGTATFNYNPSSLTVGTYPITATYSGDSNFAASTAPPSTLTVTNLVSTNTTLTLSSSTVTVGSSSPITLTADVKPTSGSGTPTGTVTFFNGTTQLGQVTLASGTASYSYKISSLAVGTYPITVVYGGDPNFASSTSSPQTLTVQATPPSFTVGGTAVSVSPGATTGNNSTITVTPSGGFTGSVTLTAVVTSSPTGATDLPTFSFGATSPVSITGANAETATLTITTTAPTSAALAHSAHPGIRWYAGGTTLAFGLLFGISIPRRRRGWRTRMGALVFLVLLIAGSLACGSGSSGTSSTGNPGTTPGAYTITVTGTSGSTTAKGSVTLTVQ
jgi:uncharacterized repeat protein (TIGR03803 family)